MSKADKIEDKKIEEFLKFLKIASETCQEKGKYYKFICPLCGEKAEGIRNTCNGHLWAMRYECNSIE